MTRRVDTMRRAEGGSLAPALVEAPRTTRNGESLPGIGAGGITRLADPKQRVVRPRRGHKPPPSVEFQLRCLGDLRRVLEREDHTTTYQFALVHALADLSVQMGTESGDELRLSVRDIARRFVELYWPQVAPWPGGDDGSVLVQNTGRRGGHRRRAAVVRKVLEARRESGHDIARRRIEHERWERLVTNVYKTVRHGPLLQIQTFDGEARTFLYDTRVEGRGRAAFITLHPGVAYCLRRFYPRVVGLARGAWTRFVHRTNPGLPVQGAEVQAFLFGAADSILSDVRDPLVELQEDRCLYCDEPMGAAAQADRLVPWDRFSVELGHNLVTAHEGCIVGRGEGLPTEASLSRWIGYCTHRGHELEAIFEARGIPHAVHASLEITAWAYGQDDVTDTVTRIPAPSDARGSRRWIQDFVNRRPSELAAAIGEASRGRICAPIDWVSPLEGDDHAEYAGQGALDRLGLVLPDRSLASFWPQHGPEWDALGRDANGAAVLVETKASVTELLSAPSGVGPSARAGIEAALQEAAEHLGVGTTTAWSTTFFQYARGLAHLHLLRQLNGIDAWLVSVYFIGDQDVRGPMEEEEWGTALNKMHRALGLPPIRLPERAIEVFLKVG